MAMAVGEKAEGEPMSDINTTPLIDVMLVLLIMLIITIPPQRHAVNLDTPLPPPPGTPPPTDIIEPIRVMIDFDGTIYWNGSIVTHDQMEEQMKFASQRNPQPELHIEPHRLAKYRYVASVMAASQRQGLTKIGVIGGTN
jgi:biopolymer transport protein ExbD